MSKSARTTNSVEISFGILGEIEVDDHVHGLDIDATREEIRTHQVAADPITEVVENAVPIVL